MSNYRRLWEQAHSACLLPHIEIHHIDGNRNNNNISNLLPVTIEEHFDIHYEQSDYLACLMIAKRANISIEKRSELAKIARSKQPSWSGNGNPNYGRGYHGKDNPFYGKSYVKGKKWYNNGEKEVLLEYKPNDWHQGRLPNKLHNINRKYTVYTSDGIFPSYKEAERQLNMRWDTIRYRCNSKHWKEWYVEEL